MAANNLFKRAKAYSKAHPRTTYQEAIKLLSKKGKKTATKKKPAAKKKTAVRKKTATKKTAVRKTTSVKRTGHLGAVNGIASKEFQALTSKIRKWQDKHDGIGGIKAGMTAKEKADIKKAKLYYKGLIKGAKSMLTQAKKSM